MTLLDHHRLGSRRGGKALGYGLLGCLLLIPLWCAAPALAHHVADLGILRPTLLNGVLSGLAHPVLGPDHLLFLLALSLVGLQRRGRWALGLLVVGLLGSSAGVIWPGLPGAEVLVAGTLIVVALVLLRRLPALVLLPAMALHGYVLSGPVFGWTSMPLAAYGAGLLASQGSLLLLSLVVLRPAASRLTTTALRWLALTLIACGGTWALAGLSS